jgi:hypothetical protein
MKPTTQTGTTTLERIKTAGKIRLGYSATPGRIPTRTSRESRGFSVAVCQKLADAVSAQPNVASQGGMVELALADRFNARRGQGGSCGADTER